MANIKEYLAEDGIVVIATMCGSFTSVPGCSFKYPILSANGIAQRHIATEVDLLEEVQEAGFRVEKKTVKNRESAEEQDELFLILSRTF